MEKQADPTQEEIAERAAQIREEWSEEERMRRYVGCPGKEYCKDVTHCELDAASQGYSRAFKDLTGEQFGRLTVISRSDTLRKGTFWHCLCSCSENKHIIVSSSNLVQGNTKSCGCLRRKRKKRIV